MKIIKSIRAERIKGFTSIFKDNSNNIFYLVNGKYHRKNGPAIEWSNGYKEWYLHGEFATSEEEFYNPLWRKRVEIKIFL